MFGFASRVEAQRALEHAEAVLKWWHLRQRTAGEEPSRCRLVPEARSFAVRILRLGATPVGEPHWGFEITVPPSLGAEGARLVARLVYHSLADPGTWYYAAAGAKATGTTT